MKIIKEGVKQEPKPQWWVGRKFSCSGCGCIFQMEEGDYNGTAVRFHVKCPTCKGLLCLTKPLEVNEKQKEQKAIFEEIFGSGGVFESIFGKSKITRQTNENIG